MGEEEAARSCPGVGGESLRDFKGEGDTKLTIADA